MRKKFLIIGLLLLVFSVVPLFQMLREVVIDWGLNSSYKIEQTYIEQDFPTTIDVQEIEVKGHHIEIVEEQTGKKASLTIWDREEGVEAGDIIKLHLFVDGQKVSQADEIWLSNRDRGSRYYSWLDVLTVNNQVAIVQRLTDDDEAMENRKWKVIWIDEQGTITEEKVLYQKRNENPLAVRLINIAGTSFMSMGYYSDIRHVYPSIYFPLAYPFGTGLAGTLLCFIAFFPRKKSYFTE